MTSLKKTLLLGLTTMFASAWIGCSDDDEIGKAEIRVIHASPDAPGVDIYIDGVADPVITNLKYGDASAYLSVDEGDYNFLIRATGAAADSAPAFSTGPLTLNEGDRVSALAAGLLASTNDADKFRVLPLAEGFDSPAAGNAIVRIVHASADAPTVAIDVNNDGTPELSDVSRFAESGPAGVELPAGQALQIGIWAESPLARVTAFTTPELPEAGELFVIATGLIGKAARQADGFSLLAVGANGVIGTISQNPVVYALHASPDAPAVDIYAGTAKLVDNAEFGDLSQPIQVAPGQYTLDFYETGTGPGTPVVSVQTPQLAAGEQYLAAASGFLTPGTGQASFQLVPAAEAFVLDDSANGRVRVVHASPDAPAVDVSTLDQGQMAQPVLVGALPFSNATAGEGLSVPPGTITLGVAAAGQLDPVATFNIPVKAGIRAFAVAAGALVTAHGQQSFRILIVDTSASPWAVVEVPPN
ncbi:MAG: DUF4397 domain-containing protein [Proteobacteria bacterium]|nr:DUF4397 domain-containing protein [Pseudomonadota bacterium]